MKLKILMCRLLLLAMFLVLISAESFAESPLKPRVAIKAPLIGEGVSDRAKKDINLATILAEMESSIQKSRKFDLVSRSEAVLGAISEEQEFAKSELTDDLAATEGKIQTANYLILPTIQDFKFYRSVTAVPNIANKYKRRDSGMLEINAQVIDTETGGIKTTFYLKSSFGTKTRVVNSKYGKPNSTHFTKMAKDVSAQMADQLVDAVFPMKVLNAQGKQVWINRGKDGGLKIGDELKVFRPGIDLIDPDTGEFLGSSEMEIGKIKVTRVNPKFTIAEISDTAPDETVQKGDIVREP